MMMNIPDNFGVDAQIAARPRVSLTNLPTPLEHARSMSTRLGRRVLVKRDDVMSLALGGNKVRKLEFLIGTRRKRELTRSSQQELNTPLTLD
jgi:1-aminocyclopropane-1-carboxylate deaminase/D-cysteine desulfhydrase-like pyridoxal-dependent ACC family enzyme